MNKKHKLWLGLTLLLVMLMGSTMSVFAAGSTVIDFSKKSLAVGEDVTVTVSGTESGTMNIKFDPQVLSLTSCDTQGYTVNGSTVTVTGRSVKLAFKAAQEGKSVIAVSSDTLTGSSATLSVAGGSAEQTNDTTTTDETTDTTATDETTNVTTDTTTADAGATGPLSYDGVEYVVSEKYSSADILSGFEKVDVTINGKNYKELSNGTMTLLYLKPASDTRGQGTFFVYDTASNTVSPMTFIGDKDKYVIVMTPTEMLQDSMTEASCTVGDKEVGMYQLSGEANDFYYVYGMNQNQEMQWYQYDAKDGSIQRVNEALFAEDSSQQDVADTQTVDASNESKATINPRYVIEGAILIFAIVIIVLINIKILRKPEYDEDDETDENDDGEVGVITIDDLPAAEETKEDIKAKKRAEKEAAREARLAAKDAEREAKIAAKDAEREAKIAAKDAKKEAKIAEKEAEFVEKEDIESAAKEAEKQAKEIEKRLKKMGKEVAPDEKEKHIEILDLNDL